VRIGNVAVPGCLLDGGGAELAPVDVVVDGARIASISPATAAPPGGAPGDIDGRGGILIPAFVDMHTHIDKGHIWPRSPNPDGTFAGAIEATQKDRAARWRSEDVAARMDFSLRAAYAHGTAALRTHLDSRPPQDDISWPVFAEMRQRWAGRITLQGVSLLAIDDVPDEPGPLFDKIGSFGGIVGAVLFPAPRVREKVAALLAAAGDRGADLDFHVDETLDPASDCLAIVAAEAKRIGFSGTITCGHCCSLMTMAPQRADEILDTVADANLAIVSLPLCNLYLQDRSEAGRRTPRIRGGTLVHEMAARGIRVAVASDNTRDPFYAYGDLDMAEVWREATRVLHLDHPVGAWPRAVTATPASIMRLAERGTLRPGGPADLVLFPARDWSELFARPHGDRTVIRDGVVIDAATPDYRELDPLLGGGP